MNQFATNIITSGNSLVTKGLTFIPNLTQAEYDEAIDLAVSNLQASKSTFATAANEDVAAKVEGMVFDGLEVCKNAVDSTGDTKFDTYFEIAESVDTQIEAGSFNFISAISAWFKAKKASKAA